VDVEGVGLVYGGEREREREREEGDTVPVLIGLRLDARTVLRWSGGDDAIRGLRV